MSYFKGQSLIVPAEIDLLLVKKTSISVFLLLIPLASSATTFKCKDQSGTIEYSGSPCVNGYQWDEENSTWINVQRAISTNRENEKARRKRQFQELQKRKAIEVENFKNQARSAPNPDDLQQAENFLSGLPRGCSQHGKYVSDDGTVNVYFDCHGGRQVKGEIAIKNGRITNVR